jgi:sodium/potassium-transporting ATPase subunit alpha
MNYRTMSLVLSSGGLADADTRRKKERKTLTELTAMQWHTLSVDDVLNRLGVSPLSGLDAAQAQRRQAQYGPNRMSKPSGRWFRKIIGWVFGGFGYVALSLPVTASPPRAHPPQVYLAGSFGHLLHRLEAARRACAAGLEPGAGRRAPRRPSLQRHLQLLAVLHHVSTAHRAVGPCTPDTLCRSSRVMASIGSMLPSDVLVLRDGSRQTVPATELTRGDIVVLGMGQKMAADMRIIEISSELKFDRSSLTGESDAVQGSVDLTDENYLESRNIVMAGTSCVSGSGLGVVTSTGDSTVFGRLAKISSAPKQGRTTLETEIFRFVCIIASLAAIVATICIIVWAAFLRQKHPDFMSVSQMPTMLTSICVAFIPEGLPVCVTLSLTAVAMKLRKSRVLAKSLGTVETLGSVNVL